MMPVVTKPLVAKEAATVTAVAAMARSGLTVARSGLLDHALLDRDRTLMDHRCRFTNHRFAAAGVAAMTEVTTVLASGLDNRAAKSDSKKHHEGQSNEPFHSLISSGGGLPAALPPFAILATTGVKLVKMLPVESRKSTQAAIAPPTTQTTRLCFWLK